MAALGHRTGTKYAAWWLALAFVAAVAGPQRAAAQTAPSPEHQVEAVFLYHFTRFVTWPPRAFGDAQAPLVVGVLGDDPFGAYLDDVLRGESVNGVPLAARRFRRIDDVGPCLILFVSREGAGRLDAILPHLEGRPVLTVSDAEGFARAGGMVEFVREQGKIGLRINVDAARAAGLTISSKLLRLAEIVRTGRD